MFQPLAVGRLAGMGKPSILTDEEDRDRIWPEQEYFYEKMRRG
jgi:hypothetical protein